MPIRLRCLALLTLFAVACADDEVLPPATGTLEVVEADLSPLVTGRIVQVTVDEGDSVHVGQVLATLTQPSAVPDVAQRAAGVRVAEASAQEVRAGPRRAEIQRASAELDAAQAEAARAAREAERLRPLAQQRIISQQQLDAAQTAAKAAAERRDAARASLRLLQEGSRPERIATATAQVARERASLSAAEAVAAELTLRAPIDGVILSRNAEPGEVVTPTQATITVGDFSRPWVRVYVNGRALPYLHVKDKVTAKLDDVNRTFTGYIETINRRAEYTPRVALTERERADLMFGVKVRFPADDMLKPGLPITVYFEQTKGK